METTSSYQWCQLLLFWSCFVVPDHVPLSSGKSKWVTQNRSKYNMTLDLRGVFFGSVWHEKCQRRQDFNPLTLFLYRVTAPRRSLPLGQCATHVSSDWLTSGCGCHGKCPIEANEYPSSHLSVSRQNLHAVLVENTRCEFVCARAVDARAHKRMASEILNRGAGEHFFKVTEKVGRFIVQPCVLGHTWAYAHMVLLQVCAGKHAPLFENSLLM